MSLIKKHMEYRRKNGVEPSPKESLKITHELLDEYMQKLSIAVIPDIDDAAIITAAYKLFYESRYNALEPHEKELCDHLVRTSIVISEKKTIKKEV